MVFNFTFSGVFGENNLWIVKPGSSSRGRGIKIFDKIEDIICHAEYIGECIIQKYLEYPVLPEERKFDIRQWFLVTNWDPLELWMYDDGYVRFSSSDFSLDNYDNLIHLTNQEPGFNYIQF